MFSSIKLKASLVYLIFNQRTYSREHFAKLFWENRGLPGVLSNLELALQNLDNAILGCLNNATDMVGINANSKIWLDVFEIKNLFENESLAEALDIHQGDFWRV